MPARSRQESPRSPPRTSPGGRAGVSKGTLAKFIIKISPGHVWSLQPFINICSPICQKHLNHTYFSSLTFLAATYFLLKADRNLSAAKQIADSVTGLTPAMYTPPPPQFLTSFCEQVFGQNFSSPLMTCGRGRMSKRPGCVLRL